MCTTLASSLNIASGPAHFILAFPLHTIHWVQNVHAPMQLYPNDTYSKQYVPRPKTVNATGREISGAEAAHSCPPLDHRTSVLGLSSNPPQPYELPM